MTTHNSIGECSWWLIISPIHYSAKACHEARPLLGSALIESPKSYAVQPLTCIVCITIRTLPDLKHKQPGQTLLLTKRSAPATRWVWIRLQHIKLSTSFLGKTQILKVTQASTLSHSTRVIQRATQTSRLPAQRMQDTVIKEYIWRLATSKPAVSHVSTQNCCVQMGPLGSLLGTVNHEHSMSCSSCF